MQEQKGRHRQVLLRDTETGQVTVVTSGESAQFPLGIKRQLFTVSKVKH